MPRSRVGHVNQPADAAQQGVLELVEHTIYIGNFPEHFDELDPLFKGQLLIDDPGEVEQFG